MSSVLVEQTAAALFEMYGIDAWRVAYERAADEGSVIWAAVIVALDRIYTRHTRGN